MEYKTTDQLQGIAERHGEDAATGVMSREQRLERWAGLLRAQSGRTLNTLHGTEYQPPEIRDAMRSDNSPISVAFADPILRFQGLNDDTYGEARRFFGLKDREMHHILCYCHLGETMTAEAAALRVAAMIGPPPARIIGQAWRALAG